MSATNDPTPPAQIEPTPTAKPVTDAQPTVTGKVVDEVKRVEGKVVEVAKKVEQTIITDAKQVAQKIEEIAHPDFPDRDTQIKRNLGQSIG